MNQNYYLPDRLQDPRFQTRFQKPTRENLPKGPIEGKKEGPSKHVRIPENLNGAENTCIKLHETQDRAPRCYTTQNFKPSCRASESASRQPRLAYEQPRK